MLVFKTIDKVLFEPIFKLACSDSIATKTGIASTALDIANWNDLFALDFVRNGVKGVFVVMNNNRRHGGHTETRSDTIISDFGWRNQHDWATHVTFRLVDLI